jgi:hypothetical protein
MTLVTPLKEPIKLPTQTKIEIKSSRLAMVLGVVVVVATVALYVIFA